MTWHVTLQFHPPHGPVIAGAWENETAAARKWTAWVGTHGSHPTAVIQLTETAPHGHPRLVKTWPPPAAERPAEPLRPPQAPPA
ncbi:hypothetical protein [Streptomyces sp. DH12]|uniref:hypothetical protein n=1 Tax=Streptomyces sp. DH12 TaxID=2857010 RepID=UPI001E348851|nr:hypothetical protein [Streptomyces sp. DH12]